MPKFSLLDFVEKEIIKDNELMDCIYFELSKALYFYGDNFSNPREKISSNNHSLKSVIKKNIFNKFLIKFKFLTNSLISFRKNDIFISNCYFHLNKALKDLNLNIIRPMWSPSWGIKEPLLSNSALYKQTEIIRGFFNRGNFNQLISRTFLNYIKLYQVKLEEFYSNYNIRALLVPYDVAFFENLHIKIFKDMGIPTFIFLHGLPGRYSNIDDNRTDYLIVWGDLIKQFYIKYGFKEKKIFVSGHPYYSYFKKKALKFNFNKILVLAKPIGGAMPRDLKTVVYNRTKNLLYLYIIEKVLKGFNVKSVRFRPHPSENPNWYLKYINSNFFIIDNESLEDSLKNSTLVIGPSSTVLLEAVFYGVNYVVFEPSENNRALHNVEYVPPFDGSIEGLPVAKNEDELKAILIRKDKFDVKLYEKFIQPELDLSFIKVLT